MAERKEYKKVDARLKIEEDTLISTSMNKAAESVRLFLGIF